MMPLRRWSAPIVSFGLLLSFMAAGCGEPVREDRSINWSAGGGSVGFQHGQEGVFLADQQGGKLRKIYQPDKDVLATSTPLWSPLGRKVIFTTARDPGGSGVSVAWPIGNNPAGNIHLQRPVVYTCWLQDERDGGNGAKPTRLFEAHCDHVGYVAANLAVRWHPHADRIYYVNQIGEHGHGVFEYDLKSGRSRQAIPQTGEALIFDWTPDGAHLVCVLSSKERQENDGIWIGRPGEDDWWHVPQSGDLALGELTSVLEQLRATRPAWTGDGSRFAFVSYRPGPAPEKPGRYILRQGTLTTRTIETLAEGPEPFRELRWAPDDTRLGLVRGGPAGSLHLLHPGDGLPGPVNREPVRRFAG